MGGMKSVVLLIIHLGVLITRSLKSGGIKSVIAENLILKHQLLVLGRSRNKAPNLKTSDRFILGGLSRFMSTHRRLLAAVIVKPSTLLRFHRALVDQKYSRLFSNKTEKRPGPKGPSWLSLSGQSKDSLWSIDLFRCESLTLQSHWVLVVMGQWSRRIIGFGVHRGDVDGITVCRMFDQAISGSDPPSRLSSDNDPLFKSHRWRANLRILEVSEIKSIPYAPMSHPFIERVIGTIRREYLDSAPFWNALDLKRKLDDFRDYYNKHRTHAALSGQSPARFDQLAEQNLANINNYGWKTHCRGLFQTPVQA